MHRISGSIDKHLDLTDVLSSIPDEAFESLIGCYNSTVSDEESQALETVLGLVAKAGEKTVQPQQQQASQEVEDSLEALFGGHSNMIDMLMECSSSEGGASSLDDFAYPTTDSSVGGDLDDPLHLQQRSPMPQPSLAQTSHSNDIRPLKDLQQHAHEPQAPSASQSQQLGARKRRSVAAKEQEAASVPSISSRIKADGVNNSPQHSSLQSFCSYSSSSSSSSSAASGSPSASSGVASPPAFNGSQLDILTILGLPTEEARSPLEQGNQLDSHCEMKEIAHLIGVRRW